jgi:hypothetical protein
MGEARLRREAFTAKSCLSHLRLAFCFEGETEMGEVRLRREGLTEMGEAGFRQEAFTSCLVLQITHNDCRLIYFTNIMDKLEIK